MAVSGVLRALNNGNLANQVSNPTLITEDNEQATISIIDRIPIITSTSTASGGGVPPTVSEEVRYKIDSSDKAITEDAENHREIGISLVVTPTLLPDGTIRMQMRPRSAQITGYVVGQGSGSFAGNKYPQVTESMVETLARVPDGYSLVVGGFYGEIQSDTKSKVPGLGDIPIINFFFKSKEAAREQTSLVFIVTPKSYNPVSGSSTNSVSDTLRAKTELPGDYNWVDPYNPGPAHEPNLRRTIRGMAPTEAPYYPRADEMGTSAPRADEMAAPAPQNTKPRFSRARR
jgi:type II secretory pathway component GspD/PulD (secretin)